MKTSKTNLNSIPDIPPPGISLHPNRTQLMEKVMSEEDVGSLEDSRLIWLQTG